MSNKIDCPHCGKPITVRDVGRLLSGDIPTKFPAPGSGEAINIHPLESEIRFSFPRIKEGGALNGDAGLVYVEPTACDQRLDRYVAWVKMDQEYMKLAWMPRLHLFNEKPQRGPISDGISNHFVTLIRETPWWMDLGGHRQKLLLEFVAYADEYHSESGGLL
jgi:hypothetical protein